MKTTENIKRKVAHDGTETIWLFKQDGFERSWAKFGRVDMSWEGLIKYVAKKRLKLIKTVHNSNECALRRSVSCFHETNWTCR